jgi:uncharacterized metal-binding protein
MRYGIPLLGNRVAPRCRCADGILIVTKRAKRRAAQRWMSLAITEPRDLIAVLERHRVDAVVCGGISREERDVLTSRAPTVIENVACSVDELLVALEEGSLREGFGLTSPGSSAAESLGPSTGVPHDRVEQPRAMIRPVRRVRETASTVDCIRCTDKKCLRGESCVLTPPDSQTAPAGLVLEMLEAATDISSEKERQLCRLAELVYFCLEMRYRKIGIAYCVDLQEPAEILAGVLDRSFETVSVCCKVGTVPRRTPSAKDGPGRHTTPVSPIDCNPLAQARLLNQAGTDLNVIVGLSMGADCVFAQESEAPVTTLFVKDKSLANNPIGAVYSEYYLRESVSRSTPSLGLAGRTDWWKDELSDRRSSPGGSGREERS